ncbi:MAG: hypothetical protein WC595_00860 [Candidatus Nanoarchaeia archaeon]
MVERVISKKRYFIAFLLTTGIFVIGLLLGAVLTESKFTELKDLQQDLRIQLASYDIQALLVQENPCKFKDVDGIVVELGSLANRLTAMEDQLGKQDPDVLKLKEYYSLLELRHWLFLKKLNEQCGTDYRLLLYFYSSDEKTCPDCESQGYILSYLRAKYPNVRVYSFDADLDDPALNALKSIYAVKTSPSITLDDTLYTGFQSKEQLETKLSTTRYLAK